MKKFSVNKYFFVCLSFSIIILLIYYFRDVKINEPLHEGIKVEIKGAVINPGVYELSTNSRMVDLIEISGGLSDEGNVEHMNLSKRLYDEMVIVIYTNEEIKSFQSGNSFIRYVERECNCPILENDGCIESIISNNSFENQSNRISLNTGTLEELQTLPGIGLTKAQAIIDYRVANNGFKEVREIVNVKGIGEATYEKIKSYLML